jgi:LBP / BPI / CETP family, C-terminal domain
VKLFINGTIFDEKIGYQAPSTPIADLHLDMTAKNQMVVDFSQYSVDSLLMVIQQKGYFKLSLDDTTFGGVAKEYLTTTVLDGFLPGIVAKYGKD